MPAGAGGGVVQQVVNINSTFGTRTQHSRPPGLRLLPSFLSLCLPEFLICVLMVYVGQLIPTVLTSCEPESLSDSNEALIQVLIDKLVLNGFADLT